MHCDLTAFGLPETLRTGREIRRVCGDAQSLEEAAQRICKALYAGLHDGPGSSLACVLIRCYKTHPFGELPSELQAFVRSAAAEPDELREHTKCLVLLGTAGSEPDWNSRLTSRQHQAIALSSVGGIQQAPMIARLFSDFGVELQKLVNPADHQMQTVRAKTYGVFYVENANGSPAIPAQEFVRRHHVTSVIGCGGELPRDEMFASILFSRVSVDRTTAERFRTLALDMKASFFRFGTSETFS